MNSADKWVYIIVACLLSIGLIFSYSLPIYLETFQELGEFYFFKKFLFFAVVSILILYILSQCNPHRCIPILGFSIFFVSLIVVVLMPTPILSPYCPVIKGARRWIKIAGVTISPTEFLKVGMIYFFAWGFSRKLTNNNFETFKEEMFVVFPYLIVIGFTSLFIILFQSDLGQTLLIFILFIIMMIFTKASFKIYTFLITIVVIVGAIGLSLGDYRIARLRTMLFNIYLLLPDFIQSWFDVSPKSVSISFQIKQGINAIYNGGLFGKGPGNGEFKLGFLSDVHTDFVLAGISEEIGFLGVLLVMMLILALIWRIFKIANRIQVSSNQDKINQFFAIGVGLLIGLETILNAMGIIGFFPLKGLPIPFVSYGGSAIISCSIAVGMVLSLSKKAKL